MSDIVTVRDPEVIAAEINTIKRQIREAAIFASIRIGEKLAEAKSMVPHGQWGRWLEENVEYSQSTANYLMQLYQEYGTGQQDLFDTWTNSQTFGKLSYSQHIALLALPFGERQQFAEEVGAENLSTRELQKAIRERDEAVIALEEAERNLDAAGNVILDMETRLKKEADREREQTIRLEKAEKARETAETELRRVREEAERLKEETVHIRKTPEVPEAMLAELRREAEEAAAKRVEAEVKQKVLEAEKAVADAVRREQEERAAAQKARADAEAAARELEQLQKKGQLGHPDVAVFQTLFTQIQDDWNRCHGALIKMKGNNPEGAAGCCRAIEALLAKIGRDLEGV